MELTMANLEKCFKAATDGNYLYIGLKIQMEGAAEAEVIINPTANFDSKYSYYKNAYTDDLALKSFNGIRIVGFTYGMNYSDIEGDLIGR